MAQWAKYMENKFNYESKAEQSASRINILTTTYERVTQIVWTIMLEYLVTHVNTLPVRPFPV